MISSSTPRSDSQKKITVGVLLHAPPDDCAFHHAVAHALEALKEGKQTYLYLLHHAVRGAHHPAMAALEELGVRCFACSLALEQEDMEPPAWILPAGLTLLSDILLHSDEIGVFNPS